MGNHFTLYLSKFQYTFNLVNFCRITVFHLIMAFAVIGVSVNTNPQQDSFLHRQTKFITILPCWDAMRFPVPFVTSMDSIVFPDGSRSVISCFVLEVCITALSPELSSLSSCAYSRNILPKAHVYHKSIQRYAHPIEFHHPQQPNQHYFTGKTVQVWAGRSFKYPSSQSY